MPYDFAHHAPAQSADLFGQILQEIGFGVVLIDDQGRVQFANHFGRSELRDGCRLVEREGCVDAHCPRQQRRFAAAVKDARQGKRALVELGSEGQARMFALIPLSRQASATGAETVLILCSRQVRFEPALMTLYAGAIGLTTSECDVLACLCRGLVAQDIALRRSVGLTTVRSQIRSIRDKAGARTVVELVARISSLPPLTGLAAQS